MSCAFGVCCESVVCLCGECTLNVCCKVLCACLCGVCTVCVCVVDGVCTVAWCVQVKRMIGGTGNMLFSI